MMRCHTHRVDKLVKARLATKKHVHNVASRRRELLTQRSMAVQAGDEGGVAEATAGLQRLQDLESRQKKDRSEGVLAWRCVWVRGEWVCWVFSHQSRCYPQPY
jgi:hypothetical protein